MGMLLSRRGLQRVLGVIWLIDGLLQLQPQMFTMNMVNGVMRPMLEGQPPFLAPLLQYIVNTTTQHLAAVNLVIAVVQILLGLGFIFLDERWVRALVVGSFVWALVVWLGGEGLSMLLTGTSSVLSGAPGAVMLYPILGLAVWPRQPAAQATAAAPGAVAPAVASEDGLLSRQVLRWVLAGFWGFAALLQMQPNWWQPGQISGAISAMVGAGGLNSAVVDPILTWLSNATTNLEVPLNILLIVVFLALGIGLAWPNSSTSSRVRFFLGGSILVSLIMWYFTQAFGMILTGMATDFNSGLLLVVMALAVWPRQVGQQAQAAASGQQAAASGVGAQHATLASPQAQMVDGPGSAQPA